MIPFAIWTGRSYCTGLCQTSRAGPASSRLPVVPMCRIVLEQRGRVPQDRVHHATRDASTESSREKRVASPLAASSSSRSYGFNLVRRLVVGDQLDLFPFHLLPWLFDVGPQRDRYVRTDPESAMVG